MLHLPANRLALTGTVGLAILVIPVAATAQGTPTGQGAAAASQPLTRSMLSTQIDATFKNLDTNGDKALNTAEIDAAQKRQVAQVQANIGKRLDAEFAKLDANKDGQLSLTEFKAAAPAPKVTPAAELLGQLDRNKDGKVTADEYRALPLGNFDRIDTNKDGTISAQEKSAVEQPR